MPTEVLPKRFKITQAARISRKLVSSDFSDMELRLAGYDFHKGRASFWGFCCSERWAKDCVALIKQGRIQIRKSFSHLENDLFDAGVYPPGGDDTLMVEDEGDGRYYPPHTSGGTVDGNEDSWSMGWGFKVGSSSGAVQMRRIETYGRKRR